MHEIFISYRQGDKNAGDLKQALDRRFYRDVAFRDVDSPTTGRLPDLIVEKIRGARFVLFMISRNWIAHFGRQLPPNDYLSLEIDKTLTDKKVFIPIYVGPSNVKSEFKATFFDSQTGMRAPTAPTFVDEIEKQLFVELNFDNSRQNKAHLNDLFRKLEPGLACYWRRMARWRWLGYCFAAFLVSFFLLVVIGLIAFWNGYAVESPGPMVVHRLRHKNGEIRLKLRPPAPTPITNDTPLKDKHQNWMDQWLRMLKSSVQCEDQQRQNAEPPEKRGEYRHIALQQVVSEEKFSANYQTFSAALKTTDSGYEIERALAFLVHYDDPDVSYAPTYRQFLVTIASDVNGLPRHTVMFTNPNEHEEILIIAVIKDKQARSSFEPSNVLLKLEVFR